MDKDECSYTSSYDMNFQKMLISKVILAKILSQKSWSLGTILNYVLAKETSVDLVTPTRIVVKYENERCLYLLLFAYYGRVFCTDLYVQ